MDVAVVIVVVIGAVLGNASVGARHVRAAGPDAVHHGGGVVKKTFRPLTVGND
jgi:hypothetical protein